MICVLMKDGRLYGPFDCLAQARDWAALRGPDAFSTYDLLPPEDPMPIPASEYK